MKTRRRNVLLGASAVVAAGSLPAPAIAQGIKELKMVTSTKIPNCRYVVGPYAMYARYGKQGAGIAGGSDGCCATRHYAFN